MHGSRGIQIVMVVMAAILLLVVAFADMPKADSKYIFLISMIIITGACIMNPIIQIGKKIDKDNNKKE